VDLFRNITYKDKAKTCRAMCLHVSLPRDIKVSSSRQIAFFWLGSRQERDSKSVSESLFHGMTCDERWGAGVEYHFHERWGAGVEYHFQEFNEPYAPS